jgi:mRNA-degrading endonuclease RelE of RelBE toxin-antitoxin system
MIDPERTPYQLKLGRSTAKALTKISRENYVRILDALLFLCATGRGDVRGLEGYEKGTLRLRVGKMRIYLRLTEHLLEVIGIDPRGEAYKTKSRAKLKK